MIKVSIIVPVYNVLEYLPECIESLLSQSYKNYEIILVNDGSNDGSGNLCDEYTQNYENIFVLHKENGGISSARNAGLDLATGDYIAFVDSDGFVSSDYLKVMVDLIEKYDCDLVCCDYNRGKVVDWSQKEEVIEVRENKEILKKMYINDGQITVVWNKLYSKSFFTDNNLRFKEGINYEDMQLMPRILHNAEKMVITNRNLYFYRQREGAITKTKGFTKKRLDLIYVVEDRIKFLDLLNEKNLYYREIEGYMRKLIRYREKMDKYNYYVLEDRLMLEKKLLYVTKKYLLYTQLGVKIKLKALRALIKFKINKCKKSSIYE